MPLVPGEAIPTLYRAVMEAVRDEAKGASQVTGELRSTLGCCGVTVTGVFRALARDGYVEWDPAAGYRLTEDGVDALEDGEW